MLSGVADFKAPVFEPGGSMQQGMYTPKGTFSLLAGWCAGATCIGDELVVMINA